MLEKVKMLLGFTDTAKDELLGFLLSTATERLKNLLGGTKPPTEMEYIIIEVAVKRYNRIGSEGATSHSVDGESVTYNEDDFAPYANEIQAFLSRQKKANRGRLKFL